jgi:hypothetical protein
MTTAIVADLYDRHVRRLPTEQQIELLTLIAQRLARSEADRDEPPARSIKELHGVGRASWDGSDAQEFVDELRAEWDERP